METDNPIAKSLPPAMLTLSIGSGRSARIVFQFASAMLRGSICTTRQFGAP